MVIQWIIIIYVFIIWKSVWPSFWFCTAVFTDTQHKTGASSQGAQHLLHSFFTSTSLPHCYLSLSTDSPQFRNTRLAEQVAAGEHCSAILKRALPHHWRGCWCGKPYSPLCVVGETRLTRPSRADLQQDESSRSPSVPACLPSGAPDGRQCCELPGAVNSLCSRLERARRRSRDFQFSLEKLWFKCQIYKLTFKCICTYGAF